MSRPGYQLVDRPRSIQIHQINVLDYQVPQVKLFFSDTGMPYRKVVTLTLGGNDMLQILSGADTAANVLASVGNNLFEILTKLTTDFPDARIYVANYYDPRLTVPGEDLLVAMLNQVIGGVVAGFRNAVLVDIHSAFDGRSGLLLIEKKGSNAFEVHPTNAGYRVITRAFEDAIGGH